jgi:hypothetical protein
MNLHHSLTRHLRIRESAERLARRKKMGTIRIGKEKKWQEESPIENTRRGATTGISSGLRRLRVYPRLFCLVSPRGKSNSVEVSGTVGLCLEALTMNRSTIASLREELAFIYFADVRYWRQGTKASREAPRGYHSRQDRVRETEVNFVI